MRPIHILFALFFLVPLIEIYLLVAVGGLIGPFATVFAVVFTAVLGAWLLRLQGFSTLQRVRLALARGETPALEMLEGMVLLVGGALLLTPGFFTDALGFACLIPPLRRLALSSLAKRFFVVQHGQGPADTGSGPTTIEGEFRREDD